MSENSQHLSPSTFYDEKVFFLSLKSYNVQTYKHMNRHDNKIYLLTNSLTIQTNSLD